MLTTEGIGGGQTPTVFVSSDNPHEAQSITDHYAQDQSKDSLLWSCDTEGSRR
jgi:hypothetical protein